ncbi:MAG: methylmalonyl-CoA mutase [Deltaproteobacteria bacterium]|jgi:methylmalonyl-CoA mutase C-terminal domain/subunit|nr:methylmalonyl-CoA mutase [Deltaproteobacteria bacterium]
MKKIRVLIGMMGLDQHEAGAIGVSRMLRDAGMEVVYMGRFNSSDMIIQAALQEDVDLIGLSFHSWDFLYYVPEMIEMMKERDLSIPIIVGGSVITVDDASKLRAMGAADAFCPSASDSEIIESIKRIAGEGSGHNG